MKKLLIAFVVIGAASMAGCATYKTTLTNAKGESVTCEAHGKNGIITGMYLKKGFTDCVNNAKANGYTQGSTETSTSK